MRRQTAGKRCHSPLIADLFIPLQVIVLKYISFQNCNKRDVSIKNSGIATVERFSQAYFFGELSFSLEHGYICPISTTGPDQAESRYQLSMQNANLSCIYAQCKS